MTYSLETVPEKTETERMETEDISEEVSAEMPDCRPLSLGICTPDDALDMSANNTLSFVFTQPPRLFTVNVSTVSLVLASLLLLVQSACLTFNWVKENGKMCKILIWAYLTNVRDFIHQTSNLYYITTSLIISNKLTCQIPGYRGAVPSKSMSVS